MIWTQLVYGTVVATNFIGGSNLFTQGAGPYNVSAPSAIEIFEGAAERMAAAQLSQSGKVPFTLASTNRAGFVISTNYLADYWESGTNLVLPGTWQAWSFNPFRFEYGYDFQRFLPWVGWHQSSFQWQQAAEAIERAAPYYVRSYTPTSVTMWSVTGLWAAAGSSSSGPWPDADFESQYSKIGTARVWILYRALTNLVATAPAYNWAASYSSGVWSNSETLTNSLDYEEYTGEANPTWAYGYTNTPGWNATNILTTWTPPAYPGATNGARAGQIANDAEWIFWRGYGDWDWWDSPATQDPNTGWNRTRANGQDVLAVRSEKLYSITFPSLASGVTAQVEWSFQADYRVGSQAIPYNFSYSPWSNFWIGGATSSIACSGVSTGVAGVCVVTAAAPSLVSVVDLSGIISTGLWDSAGRYSDVVHQRAQAWAYTRIGERRPVVRWTFTRCRP